MQNRTSPAKRARPVGRSDALTVPSSSPGWRSLTLILVGALVLVAACDGGEHSVAGSGAEAADQPAVAQEDGGNQEGGETGPDGGDGAAGGVASSESGSAGDGTASSLGPTPAPGASDIGLEPLERKGNLAITATNPRVFSRIAGACDANDSQVQFLSDDGLTRFVVFTGGVVGAAGEITADVEGANVTWVAAAESETSAAQTDRTSAYYEGEFIRGADGVFAVVQLSCGG